MAGTITASLAALATTIRADDFVATPASTGFSATGYALTTNGNTAVHRDDAKMGGVAGLRIVQAGSVGLPNGYIDDTASRTVHNGRYEFNSSAPLFGVRGNANADHTNNIWIVEFTSAGKVRFYESTTGGVTGANVTGSGSIPSGADCVMMVDVDHVANTFLVQVYQRGTSTIYSEVSGSLIGNAKDLSTRNVQVRFGTNNTATGARLDLNDKTAIGFGGRLARTDLAAAVPNAGAAKYLPIGSEVQFSDATATGAPSSIAWSATTWPGFTTGAAAPTITNPGNLTGAKVILSSAGVYTFRLTVDGQVSDVKVYVYPATNAEVTVRSVTENGYTAVGGTSTAILNAPNPDTKWLQSPDNPDGTKKVVILFNPIGPGPITFKLAAQDIGGDALRKIDICRVDGTTVIYSLPEFPVPNVNTVQQITLDATALALVSTLAQRAELTLVFSDRVAP